MTTGIVEHTVSNGRTASACGVFVFYRNFVAYMLLVLYGVPAAIGPHWHSHHGCDHARVVCAAPGHSADDHSLHSDCPQAATKHVCNCQHAQGAYPFAEDTANAAAGTEYNADCGSCTICHFYACTPYGGPALSTQVQSVLMQSLVVAEYWQLRTVYELHLARGPPSGRACASA